MGSKTGSNEARQWAGLAVLALPCLMYALDLTALTAASPQLAADLRPTATQLLWINDSYGFMLAGSLLLMGNLGDRIGRRRLLLIGAAAFGALSVTASLAQTPMQLIVARSLLGIAGATLAPSTLALIGTLFSDARRRSTAVAIWITSFSAGGALGPVVAGFLLSRFWWGAVFLIAVPVMAVLLVAGPALLPESKDPAPGRLDVLSAAMSVGSVLLLVGGLKSAAMSGPGVRAAALLLCGGAVAAAFVRRQRGLRDPLLDLSLFRLPALTAALITYGLSLFVLGGMFLFTVQYLQLVLGLSPFVAGIWSSLDALALVICTPLTPMLARKVPPPVLVPAGLLVAASGMLVVAFAGTNSPPLVIALGNVVFAAGLAPVITVANDLVISTAPPHRSGAAAALSETCSELGAAMGIAVLGALGAAVYRAKLPGLPQDALGATLAAVQHLSPDARARLTASADVAFTTGLHVVAIVSALLLVGGAIVAGLVLRRPALEGQPVETHCPVVAPALSC